MDVHFRQNLHYSHQNNFHRNHTIWFITFFVKITFALIHSSPNFFIYINTFFTEITFLHQYIFHRNYIIYIFISTCLHGFFFDVSPAGCRRCSTTVWQVFQGKPKLDDASMILFDFHIIQSWKWYELLVLHIHDINYYRLVSPLYDWNLYKDTVFQWCFRSVAIY